MQSTETKIDANQVVISKGTRHVSIMVNGSSVVALLSTGNANYTLADCCGRWEGKTVAGARKWAVKHLR
jgi:hypothetical protein